MKLDFNSSSLSSLLKIKLAKLSNIFTKIKAKGLTSKIWNFILKKK